MPALIFFYPSLAYPRPQKELSMYHDEEGDEGRRKKSVLSHNILPY